jgi:Cof subfamily protein (haloacid dehalogenase superfamily)
MKYSLFISDYDGTLGVAPKNNIDEETLEAIKKFTAKGGIFAVCTGRETTSILRILRSYDLDGIVASFQGARITEIKSGKHLFNGGLDKATALKALDMVDGNGLTPLSYGDNIFYAQELNPYVELYSKAVKIDVVITDIRERVKSQEESVSKICWVGDDTVVKSVEKTLNENNKCPSLMFNSGAECLLEAINPEHAKGNAVRVLANHYGIPLDQVITVGDSTNDIGLVVGEWHGVAVGDGREELKRVAKEVTVPFNEKPVKHLLEKYCLND